MTVPLTKTVTVKFIDGGVLLVTHVRSFYMEGNDLYFGRGLLLGNIRLRKQDVVSVDIRTNGGKK